MVVQIPQLPYYGSLIIFVTWCLFATVCSQQITDLTASAEYPAGTSVSISCALDRAPPTDGVLWKKGTKVISNGDQLKPSEFFFMDDFGTQYVEVSSQESAETGPYSSTLVFDDIRYEDSGDYSCGEESTTITVVTPRVLLLAGSSIGLDCHRVPEIESKTTLQFNSSVSWWFRDSTNTEKEIASWNTNQNNITIINNTGINGLSLPSADKLNIGPIEASHEGKFTCKYSYIYDDSIHEYTWPTDLYVKVKPNAPGKPEVDSQTSSTLNIRWTKSEETYTSTVSSYSIQYTKQYTYDNVEWSRPDTTVIIADIAADISELVISDLEGDTGYAVRVIAWNEVGSTEGETSQDLKTDITKPVPPSVVFQPDVYNDRIVFTWTSRDVGTFTGFIFKMFVGRGVTGEVASIVNITRDPTDSDSAEYRYKHTVEGLTPMTEYCYVIQTVNEGVTSEDRIPPCKILQTDTNAPDAPMLIDITQDTVVNNTASVKVTFEPPECLLSEPSCVSYYRVFYRKANSTEDQVIRRFNKTDAVEADIKPQRMYTLTELPLGYDYDVSLAGVVNSILSQSREYVGTTSESKSTGLLEGVTTLPPTTTEPAVTTEIPEESTTVPPVTPEPEVVEPTEAQETSTEIIIIVVTVCSVLIVLCIIIFVIIYRSRWIPNLRSTGDSLAESVGTLFSRQRKKRSAANISVEQEEDYWIDLNTPLLGASSMGYVENDYENVGIDGWSDHCTIMHANTDIKFAEEYESICKSQGQDITWKDSLEPANLTKNRYNNIVAYDHTRVVLKTQPGVVHSDYINANYIDSYDRTRNFIATQGPLPNTIDDFWRMVWENNTNVIVMITNVYEKHKKKCEQYWPDNGEAKYGRLTVTHQSTEELAFWTVRQFTIKNTKVSKKKHQIEKKIIQYHYTEWPDHGIPEYTLPVLSFVKRATNSNPINGGPIVVHCSAGVGRTGTFIVLEGMMTQIMQKRTVNVQGFLRHIRGQRNHLVQTEDQYIFIHDALLNFIESGGRTDIQPKKFRPIIEELDSKFDVAGETILEKQYKTIVKWSPAEHLTNCPLLECNASKNRSLSYIPLDNSSRVKLPKIAGENGSDYINATYLHGQFQSKEFIITQHPSAHTEYDFWRMVWDQNSMTIVMLSNIGEEDLVTFFRPKGEATDWAHKSSFKLTFVDENLDSLEYAIRDFQLESKQDDYEMLAKMFSITCWPEAYTDTQVYSEGVFQFIEVVNKWHAAKRNQTGPIIVIDKFGGKVAAQFCALYTLYNQYNFDTQVDIYSLAYLYHKKRPGIWEQQNDYRLLYNSMLQLCESELDDGTTNENGNSGDKVDFPVNTFANVRRVNTLPRSPEHITRSDTM